MPEAVSDHWPGVPFARCAGGERASRSLAAPGTCSAREGRRSVEKSNVVSRFSSRHANTRGVPRLTATQIKIIWMLLSICGTPIKMFSKMGMSSEKLDGHMLELSRSTQTEGQSSPASGEKIQYRLLQVVIYQTT